MQGKRFLFQIGIVIVAAAMLPAQNVFAAGRDYRPPNVVLIVGDWLRRDAIGVYDEKPVQTPNIDALANSGIRFDNAYTPASLCTPARASILTGVYPHQHGLERVIYPAGFPGKIPTKHPEGLSDPWHDNRYRLWDNFLVYLHNTGYQNAHIGKWHLGTSNPGFFDYWKSFNSLMPHWVGTPYESAYREDIQTDEGIRFIEQNADRPFFLYQSYYSPHAPFQPPPEYRALYEGVDIDHKDYYAMVSSLDANVGRIVATLRRKRLLENTLIIFIADHGGSFRERPGSYRGMGVAYDETARIPMIMHWPNGLPRGEVWESGVSLVDLAPTILGAAGIRSENEIRRIITGRAGSMFHGVNLIPAIRSGEDDWSRPVFMQNIPERAIKGSRYDERAMRSQRHKLILREFFAQPGMQHNEFYDLETDPEETRNLYHDKSYQTVLRQQIELMLRWSRANDDTLAIKLAAAELARLNDAP